MALAVPARAPCSDMAKAIALGPVKPKPDTVKNKPTIIIANDACGNKPLSSTITAPVN